MIWSEARPAKSPSNFRCQAVPEADSDTVTISARCLTRRTARPAVNRKQIFEQSNEGPRSAGKAERCDEG